MTAIVTGDILLKYSVTTGAAGNSTAQANKNNSLGKYISTTQWSGGASTLFDDVSGAENSALTVDYRCIFVHNSNVSNDLQNAVVYLSAEVSGGTTIAVAKDNIAASALGASAAQAALIASETATPSGVGAFSSPTTAGTGVSLGTIPKNQCKAFWVRRTATNSAALTGDGVTIAVTGDTGSL